MEKGQSSSESDSDSSVSNTKILKRLHKLERKLKKYKRSKRRRSRSRSNSHSYNERHSREKSQARLPYNRGSRERIFERDYRRPSVYESRRKSADHTSQYSDSCERRERSRSASGTSRGSSPRESSNRDPDNVADKSVAEENNDILVINDNIIEEIASDYLKMLGDDPTDTKENSFELHSAISSRWSHILTNGLPKETRDELWQKYPLPSNCPALTPPQINPEVINILPQFHIKRDKSHLDIQNRLTRSMSALGKGINVILNDKEAIPKEQKGNLLCCLGDAAKILADLSHHSSQLRRTLIMPQMDKTVREMATTTSPGIYLFGEDFGGKVKEMKTMEKTSKELKPVYSGGDNKTNQIKKFKRGGEVQSRTYRPSFTQGKEHLNKKRPARPQREMRSQKGYSSKLGSSSRYWNNR